MPSSNSMNWHADQKLAMRWHTDDWRSAAFTERARDATTNYGKLSPSTWRLLGARDLPVVGPCACTAGSRLPPRERSRFTRPS